MDHRREIRFILNDADVAVEDVPAGRTLLDFLRLDRRLTGTKEGCAEGDCGACTVLVGRLGPAGLVYEPVNACIRFLATVDGCHVVTVEHLVGADGGLHPVQAAMVSHHASQCGFCTPGIVMTLAALRMSGGAADAGAVETALQGNLCRCTGYAPVLRAGLAACGGETAPDPLVAGSAAVAARLAAMRDGRRVELRGGESLAILPADADDLAAVLLDHPGATIVAGGTDVGLWVTKGMRQISPAVFIGQIADLRAIEADATELRIGAAATYAEAGPLLVGVFPHLGEYMDRIGGWQVRATGTIGGNIANGSPIGDMAPALIALGAEVVLRRGGARRVLPLEAFFLDYGRQDRAPGEFLESLRVPRPAPGTLHAAWKVSKRRDEDISSVAAGLAVTVTEGRITGARLAFGGMAATPRRAARAEAALEGRAWGAEAFEAAAAALAEDFAPIDDMRASAAYRKLVAQNLLRRFHLEHSGTAARLERRPAEGAQ